MQDCGLRRLDFRHAAESAKFAAALHLFFPPADFVGFHGGSSRDPRVVSLHPARLSNGLVGSQRFRKSPAVADLKKWAKSRFWAGDAQKTCA